MRAGVGSRVRFHYVGRVADGGVFDRSTDGFPVESVLGEGALRPAIEEALSDMRPGERRTVTVPPDRAYGPYRPELVYILARHRVQGDSKLQVGDHLLVATADGRRLPSTVTRLEATRVTVDANHPLAGQELSYTVELIAVEPPPDPDAAP